MLVCDSRKNALLRVGNKNDREDARKLSELLFLNKLHPVYHGETGIRTLKELARSYLAITRDLTRVMNRLKAIYRGWGIACAGQQVYAPRYRAEWLAKITEAGVRRRAEIYYQQFDALAALRQEVRRELLAESRKHPAITHPTKKAAVVLGFAQEKSIRQIARETKLNPRTVTKIVDEILPEWDEWKSKAIERTKRFVDKALDSYEFALDEEIDGRRASEFLIAKGIIENPKVQLQLSKASEVDRRTPEEKAIDAKKKALSDLVSIVIDRTDAFGSPIDSSSEKSVREHVIELHPLGEGKKK